MKYDFDEIVPRQGSDSLKYDGVKNIWGRDDLLPLWVADMDFRTPPFIIEAIERRLHQGILGYTLKAEEWYTAIQNWLMQRYRFAVQRQEIGFVGGIVPGIVHAINCFTRPGDKILVQTPVYHPYLLMPRANGRQVVESPLRLVNGQYVVDFEDFEEKLRGCKLFLFCHPHNPGGRVWKREEMLRIAQLCADNGTLVISDEIHCDLTFAPHRHIPFATLCEAARQNSVTMMSPTKAFNMAGVSTSYTIIANPQLRTLFGDYLARSEADMANIFATVAAAAAYTHGSEWLGQMLDYVQGNIDYVQNFLAAELPRIGMIRPQASYLIFLDCRRLRLTPEQLDSFFVEQAHLALNSGGSYGEPGRGFMRLNAACPRALLQKAMQQLKQAYDRQF